ncbi:MAG: tRNA (guanosine(46)-N7)-methyltransferase TrmB [Chitinophagales bacterium]|nr:tRNA (guanosine(46)-N7)-methyltransferase TrmB [Chitinophagales bacterium]
MAKNKIKHLEELKTFSNVFQLRKDLKGKWNEVFKNSNPVTLELACGKGEYSLALAKKFPSGNFIGIDIKGARIWRGAKSALEEKISNVIFLRTYIDHIEEYFAEGEVEEIWITFPDPYHASGKARKRLTSTLFLPRYKKILKQGGIVHLKTDDLLLYEFTIETLQAVNANILFHTNDLYASALQYEILEVKLFMKRNILHWGK